MKKVLYLISLIAYTIICSCNKGRDQINHVGPTGCEIVFEDNFDESISSEWEIIEQENTWLDDGWLHIQDRNDGHRDAMVRLHNSDTSWMDYTVTLDLEPLGGGWIHANLLLKVDDFLRFSGISTGHAYQLEINGFDTPSVLVLSKTDHDKSTNEELVKVSYSIPPEPIKVKASLLGKSIKVWINDDLILDVVDPDPFSFGGIGLHNIWESEARYDNVIVEKCK